MENHGTYPRDLSEIRVELDQLDTELMRLFARRQELSHEVYDAKELRGLPILDSAREADKIAALKKSTNPMVAQYGPDLMSELMRYSRMEQKRYAQRKHNC